MDPLTRTQKILLLAKNAENFRSITQNITSCSETDTNYKNVQENSDFNATIIEPRTINFDDSTNNLTEPSILNCNLEELPISVVNFDNDGNVIFEDLDKIETQETATSITTREIQSSEDRDYHYEAFEDEFENEFSEPEKISTPKRKRMKRQFVNEKIWSKNENQRRRERGKEYQGKRKTNEKWNYNVYREERKMGECCNCKISLKSKILKCREINEEERCDIFKKFWADMSWNERKVYVNLLVIKEKTKRCRNRKNDETSRRDFTWFYYLNKSNERRIRVCKNMFLNTHGLKERTVIDWKKEATIGPDETLRNVNEVQQQSENQDRKIILKNFFSVLPKVESHYCRSKSSKLYLEREWDSKTSLYKFYINWCKNRDSRPVSDALFSNVFEELNLSLFKPKKDECDVCVSYRSRNIPEEEYSLHVIKKNLARESKQRDKESSNRVFCMDMQAVLLSPKSNTSALYFKMKLMVHNFTIFDMQRNRGYCFIWHEAAGGVSADNYASIICDFLSEHAISDLEDNQNIIIYSDGCTSQNRNCTLSNALLNLAHVHEITIEQKFLEKGHSQMEADHMHSLIERKLRNAVINTPADYVRICQEARKNPSPFIVKYLSFDFFKNFTPLKTISTIRPGRKVGEPTVTDLRAIKYSPNENVYYKTCHSQDYVLFNNRRINRDDTFTFNNLPKLYSKPLPIKKDKWDHLQKLKDSIPCDFHSFYDNLPYF